MGYTWVKLELGVPAKRGREEISNQITNSCKIAGVLQYNGKYNNVMIRVSPT
jgi:hypothetical protein